MTRVSGDAGLTCTVPDHRTSASSGTPTAPARMFQHIIDDDTDAIGRDLCTPKGLPR